MKLRTWIPILFALALAACAAPASAADPFDLDAFLVDVFDPQLLASLIELPGRVRRLRLDLIAYAHRPRAGRDSISRAQIGRLGLQQHDRVPAQRDRQGVPSAGLEKRKCPPILGGISSLSRS